MNRLATVTVVVGIVGHSIAAMAQTGAGPEAMFAAAEPRASSRQTPDGVLGLELSMLVPRGDFVPGKALSVGYGVRGAVGLGARRMLDVGASFRSIAHDSRTLSDTVEMKNMLRTLAVSARLVAPLRYARPYLGASVGGAYFGTEKMVERCCDEDGDWAWVLDDIRRVDIRPTGSARLGLLVDLPVSVSAGQAMLSLDFGVEDHIGRRATYQVGGDGPIRRTGMSHRVYSVGLSLRTR